jgi:hypothetical protein
LEQTFSIINVVVVGSGGDCAPAAAAPTVVSAFIIASYNNIANSSKSTCFPATCPAVEYVLLKL